MNVFKEYQEKVARKVICIFEDV